MGDWGNEEWKNGLVGMGEWETRLLLSVRFVNQVCMYGEWENGEWNSREWE